jgi:hypothetical protein
VAEPPSATPAASDRLHSGTSWAVGGTALVLIALAAWRSTLGMTFLDDGYYVAVTIRLAQGARLFVDEMFVQSLGFFAAVPFAKLWTTLFGTTGVVAALGLYYVALATVVAALMYRILRPSFGPWAALAGVAAPLLAPAYALLMVSYDTTAALGMLLAMTLCFKALRDSSRWAAAGAGAAAAFAAISYPPLVVAAFALLITFAIIGRGRRLAGWMVAGAGAVVAVFCAWLFARASLADIRLTYDYAVGTYAGGSSGGAVQRLVTLFEKLLTVLGHRWKLPLWAWFVPALAVGIGTALPVMRVPGRERLRGWLLASLPLVLAIPVFANWSSHGRHSSLWTVGGNYLIAFVVFALPGVLAGLRAASDDVRRLVLLALPAGAVGFLVVSASTSAGIFWASGVVGLAPLVLATVVGWVVEVRRVASPRLEATTALSILLAVVVLLFGVSFKGGSSLDLHHTITSGPYAGVTTTQRKARRIFASQMLADRWVGPSTGVLFFAKPAGYILQRGVMVTNAVWLASGPKDQATIGYFDRTGRWPDVVFVSSSLISPSGVVRGVVADPLLAALAARYRVVETSAAAGLGVLVRMDSGVR